MSKRKSRPFYKRLVIDIAGFGLLIIAALTAWLPGPGGIPLVIAALAILSLNYEWAEKLMKDLDKKRVELSEKYLNVSREVSFTMDVISVGLIIGGAYLFIQTENVWLKGIGAGLVLFSIVILLSNQQRLERIIRKIKRK